MSNGYNHPPSSVSNSYQYAAYYAPQERRASSQRPPPPQPPPPSQYGAHATYNAMGAPSAPPPQPQPPPPMAPPVFGAYPQSFAPPAPYYPVGYDTRNVENTFVNGARMQQMAYPQMGGGAYWRGEQQSLELNAPMLPPNMESAAAAGAHGMRGAPVQKSLEEVREEARHDARNMFKKFDVDEGGYLDLQEFMDAFRALKLAITYHEAMACFAMADQNEDGRISEEEFMHTYAEQTVAAALAAGAHASGAAVARAKYGGAPSHGEYGEYGASAPSHADYGASAAHSEYGGAAGAPQRHGMGAPRPAAGP